MWGVFPTPFLHLDFMRLDKFFSEQGILTRKEAGNAVKNGRVSVNSCVAKSADLSVNENTDIISLDGKVIPYAKYVYYLLNKPEGLVSATEEGDGPSVISLFTDADRKRGIFPCGRLDKNTVGLMLITSDGALSHKLLAPKSHVDKTYFFTVKFPLSEEDVTTLQNGVDIGGYRTKPCQVVLTDKTSGKITLTEGKYHQIKLMMLSVHNQITFLERISFGSLLLPSDLKRGEYRELTQEELNALLSQQYYNA